MKRREAILKVSLLMGGSLSAPALTGLLNGCRPKTAQETTASATLQFFTPEQEKLVAEISEIIIPTTNTPGAKAANVSEFIDVMLADCYPEKDQKSFIDGLNRLESKSKEQFSKAFLEVSPEQQVALLKEMEAEAQKKPEPVPAKPEAPQQGRGQAGTEESGVARSGAPKPQVPQPEAPIPFFRTMKELTLLGYFTSEIGATQALEYVPVPGRYDPCIPMKEGQRAWAT